MRAETYDFGAQSGTAFAQAPEPSAIALLTVGVVLAAIVNRKR
jgi:hypothetical protein